MLQLRMLLVMQLGLVCCGCGAGTLLPNRCLMDMRDRVLAKGAWHGCGSQYDGPHRGAFKDGFLDGYSDVCGGGTGQPPVVPPKKYQSACYSSQEGDSKTIAWFNGFSAGAVAASADGREGLREVVLSTDPNGGLIGAESSFPGFSSPVGTVTVHNGTPHEPYEVMQPEVWPTPPPIPDPPAPGTRTVRPNAQGEQSVPRQPLPRTEQQAPQPAPQADIDPFKPDAPRRTR
ncbi:hypothetical protein [Thalassoroseus pseudoceratinae]|uniref:hypothetical protein n=1 Tax=Thalassoroseus pseudoceratinae TaxID=2713176 RepID=UPI00141DEE32|nr:hypothetical protein [Thalassoroseus pseudoceratinae]